MWWRQKFLNIYRIISLCKSKCCRLANKVFTNSLSQGGYIYRKPCWLKWMLTNWLHVCAELLMRGFYFDGWESQFQSEQGIGFNLGAGSQHPVNVCILTKLSISELHCIVYSMGCGKNHARGYCVWISMNTEHSAPSTSSLRINVTWQWFAIVPLLILTFRPFRWLSGWVKGMEGLLWNQRVLGQLWCLGIFRVLGYLWGLRVAGILWPEWQRWIGGWDVRIKTTLLLPRQTCTLHTVLSQVSDRNLHIRERVGVPMARRADLLEVICGVKDTQR